MPEHGSEANVRRPLSIRTRLAVLGMSSLAAAAALITIPVTGGVAEEANPITPAVQEIPLGSVDAPATDVQVLDAVVNAPPSGSTPSAELPAPPSPQSSDAAPSSSTAPPGGSEGPSAAPPSPGAPTSPGSEPTASGAPAEGTQVLSLDKDKTQGFSMLGVSWAGDASAAVTATVRVKDLETGQWSEPTDLTIDPAADGAGAAQPRVGTAPYWFGTSSGVEVAVTVPDGASVHDIKLTLIDPKKVTQDANAQTATPKATAGAAGDMPPVYSRAQWGCDEKLSGWSPQYSKTLKAVTIHHSADGNNYSKDDVPGIMRSIYRYQSVTLGWGDIGYNVVVDKYGRAWEGRKGGLASTVIGAHAGGFNVNTWGLSMLGNYDVVSVPAAVKETLAQLIAWKFREYGIDPLGKTQLTQQSGAGTTAKFKDGTVVTLNTIFGHRDTGNTVCPGQYGYAMLPSLRARTAEIMATPKQTSITAYQRSSNTAGVADSKFVVGPPGSYTLACDMDGDGAQGYAVVTNGTWSIYHKNAAGQTPATLYFGGPGDIPVCGKWFGGPYDLVGIYRPSTATFYLKFANTSGVADWAVTLGNANETPIVGDWDGDGSDTVGIYRSGESSFHLAASNVPGAATSRVVFGSPGDKPLVGDFSGKGRSWVGVRRGFTYFLAPQPNGGSAVSFLYGEANDKQVFGDWDGNGSDTISVIR